MAVAINGANFNATINTVAINGANSNAAINTVAINGDPTNNRRVRIYAHRVNAIALHSAIG
ncbi:MAG TPA: hypothetical protein DEO73_00120 [Pantoea sp.]|nr:hypothetical protein [Pantoea sp.]